MTFREKLAQEHPECIDEDCAGGCKRCPSDYGYEPWDANPLCHYDRTNCTRCWDREMEEKKEETKTEEKKVEDRIYIKDMVGELSLLYRKQTDLVAGISTIEALAKREVTHYLLGAVSDDTSVTLGDYDADTIVSFLTRELNDVQERIEKLEGKINLMEV